MQKFIIGLCVCLFSHAAAANLFFKIEHPSNETLKPSYLLGTMHLLCEDQFVIPNAVTAALSKSTQLIVEVNLADSSELINARQAAFQQPANYLRRYLNASDYSKLARHTKQRLDMPLEAVAPLRPMIIGSMFLSTYLPCNNETFSLDERLIYQAEQQNIAITGLETAKWQLELFDQIELSEQVSALYELVSDAKSAQNELVEMAQTYLSGDGQALHALLLEQDDFVGAQALFLDQRNQTWAQKLPAMMADKSNFVAVGAGHLYGTQGLIALLEAKGYKITPIPLSFDAAAMP